MTTLNGHDRTRRSVPASLRVLVALTLVVVTAALPPTHVYLGFAMLPCLVAYAVMTRAPLGRVLRSIAVAEPLVLTVSVLLLLRPNGFWLFAIVVSKATLCLAITQLLVHTTPFHEILGALKAARVPALLITTVSLLHRYFPILADESIRMRRARAARKFGGTSGVSSWRMLANVIGVLFLRSTERAERVDAAMRARGWS